MTGDLIKKKKKKEQIWTQILNTEEHHEKRELGLG